MSQTDGASFKYFITWVEEEDRNCYLSEDAVPLWNPCRGHWQNTFGVLCHAPQPDVLVSMYREHFGSQQSEWPPLPECFLKFNPVDPCTRLHSHCPS